MVHLGSKIWGRSQNRCSRAELDHSWASASSFAFLVLIQRYAPQEIDQIQPINTPADIIWHKPTTSSFQDLLNTPSKIAPQPAKNT
mmetsp:Transcript_45307/g.78355  ORF Transcript_45307/g.78355 Transcript_45307/m.78355 type:complete len:86 (+) Transcript_45307:110-367(+)